MRRIITLAAAAICSGALILSGASPSAGASKPRHYHVHPGDSLWGIAVAKYPDSDTRETVFEIQQANHLGSEPLAVGQNLVLP